MKKLKKLWNKVINIEIKGWSVLLTALLFGGLLAILLATLIKPILVFTIIIALFVVIVAFKNIKNA
jgi:hypothetical protein